jgi:hypothetical protein
MKQLYVALLLAPLTVIANTNTAETGVLREDRTINTPIPAGSTVIMRHQLGSGTPGFRGLEPATHMGEGIYHAPQYMPSFPTAGTIWPRVVEVECDRTPQGAFVCDGYDWLPSLGRGEYLFIRPMVKAPAPVVEKVIERVVPGPERVILKEVEVKPKKQ